MAARRRAALPRGEPRAIDQTTLDHTRHRRRPAESIGRARPKARPPATQVGQKPRSRRNCRNWPADILHENTAINIAAGNLANNRIAKPVQAFLAPFAVQPDRAWRE